MGNSRNPYLRGTRWHDGDKSFFEPDPRFQPKYDAVEPDAANTTQDTDDNPWRGLSDVLWLETDLFVQAEKREKVFAVSKDKVLVFWQLEKRWPGMTRRRLSRLAAREMLRAWHPAELAKDEFSLVPIDDECWREQATRLAKQYGRIPPGTIPPLLILLSEVERLEKEYPYLLDGEFPGSLLAGQQANSSDPGAASGGTATDQGEGQPGVMPYRRTVNAERWQKSLETALSVCLEIVQGEKTDWKRPEFEDEFYRRYKDVLTEAIDIAWRTLPEKFKKGPGRARVTEENPDKWK